LNAYEIKPDASKIPSNQINEKRQKTTQNTAPKIPNIITVTTMILAFRRDIELTNYKSLAYPMMMDGMWPQDG
jgi:hypothetical protein